MRVKQPETRKKKKKETREREKENTDTTEKKRQMISERRGRRERKEEWKGKEVQRKGESSRVGVGRTPQVRVGGMDARASSHQRASPSLAVCPCAPTGKLKDKKNLLSKKTSLQRICVPRGSCSPSGRNAWGLAGQTGPWPEYGCPVRQVHAE